MTKNRTYLIGTLLILSLMLVGISACVTPPSGTEGETQAKAMEASLPRPVNMQFPILPFPTGYEMDRDRSFVYESGQGKIMVGGIHLVVADTPDQMVSFYRAGMQEKGWRLIRMVDHRGTIMLYETKTLICTITVEPMVEKTQVIIHIGPK
ncbi:MAG: hypothetical protein OEZ51_13450 [Nitrospinota bacterium]|nr:hypothetical protein [Nitrospinota bacterium]